MTDNIENSFKIYIASRFSGAAISDFGFLASGFESEIYAFRLHMPPSEPRDCILRLFPGDGALEKLTREAQGLRLLHRLGYPVPGLFIQETDASLLDMPFEIIDRLEGQSLWPLLSSCEPDQARQLLTRFGSLLAQLHTLDWRLFCPHPNVYEQDPSLLLDELLSSYRTLYAKYHLIDFVKIVDWLAAHQSNIVVRPAVVHQDFHANNVLLGANDQLYVIDWTQCAVSDYRIDLCWTLFIMGEFGNAGWGEHIRNTYEMQRGEVSRDMEYFNVIVYMKMLGSVAVSYLFDPKEVGLRPEMARVTKDQLSMYEKYARRIAETTGIKIPGAADIRTG